MNKRIGFIGSGNMGKAIIGGLMSAKVIEPGQITVFDIQLTKVQELQIQYGINAVDSAKEAVDGSDIVFIAVKPDSIHGVLSEILGHLRDDTVIVSIAAGIPIDAIETVIGKERKIVRIMPNTPALVGEGMSSVTPNHRVTQDELNDILTIFNSFGRSEVVSEHLIHAVTGISGSSPAYVFMFIEAMADAAVLAGLPRAQAYQFAAQAVLGSAKMVLETGKHPAELKDMVCSPGGTTIEAVKTLEERGFRSAVIDAIGSCVEKSKSMSEK